MTRTLISSIALTLALTLTGCSGNESEPVKPAASPSSTTPAARVTLELVDNPDPAAPQEVVIGYHGRRPTRFLLQLTPPELGAIVPESVRLKPERTETLRVVGLAPGTEATVRVIDTGSDDEVASLVVTGPTPPGS